MRVLPNGESKSVVYLRRSLRTVLHCSSQGSQEEKKDLLQDLQSELKGKTIIDVTTASYLKDESKWGQTSTTHMNQEALAVPAKWVRCWNTVFVVGCSKDNVL